MIDLPILRATILINANGAGDASTMAALDQPTLSRVSYSVHRIGLLAADSGEPEPDPRASLGDTSVAPDVRAVLAESVDAALARAIGNVDARDLLAMPPASQMVGALPLRRRRAAVSLF